MSNELKVGAETGMDLSKMVHERVLMGFSMVLYVTLTLSFIFTYIYLIGWNDFWAQRAALSNPRRQQKLSADPSRSS
jgi:hypothetical protein